MRFRVFSSYSVKAGNDSQHASSLIVSITDESGHRKESYCKVPRREKLATPGTLELRASANQRNCRSSDDWDRAAVRPERASEGRCDHEVQTGSLPGDRDTVQCGRNRCRRATGASQIPSGASLDIAAEENTYSEALAPRRIRRSVRNRAASENRRDLRRGDGDDHVCSSREGRGRTPSRGEA
jgi:hypothetical protein